VRYIRGFALFNVCSSTADCLSLRRASNANVVCRSVGILGASYPVGSEAFSCGGKAAEA
jgi:hypothetical protein